jgi:hypothetical protein
MYQNLMFGVKRRIIEEIELAFQNHPAFAEKVQVFNKFPFEQRIQFGAVLRNTSGSVMRMSADNYLAELNSHVKLAKLGTYSGTSIEWCRENSNDITKLTNEDLSAQVDPTNRLFHTANQICSGPENTFYANNKGQVSVTINGYPAGVERVFGEDKTIILEKCPQLGDIVKITYWYRTLVPPGIYMVNFMERNSFWVDTFYSMDNQVLFNKTTGLETSYDFGHSIFPDTEEIYLKLNRNITEIKLVRGVDYSIDNDNGIITFLNPVPPDYKMMADYRYRPFAEASGPYTFKDYEENHTAIPGVVLCMGRREVVNDQQMVIVSQFREPVAKIYGGHWQMSLQVGVISKDVRQMEESVDQIVNWLWGVRKNVMEFEGITLNSVEPTGESEEVFIESTGDLYYESSIDISVMTEWQRYKPYLYSIRHINASTIIEPDIREVIKAPTIGYSRVE